MTLDELISELEDLSLSGNDSLEIQVLDQYYNFTPATIVRPSCDPDDRDKLIILIR